MNQPQSPVRPAKAGPSTLTPEEIADQQPRSAGEKPCSNPTCSLRRAHRGPCAPAADGTYRSARAGETITTAAELDALPIDTVVLDCANIPRTKRRADSVMGAGWTHAGRSPLSSEMLADGHPLTVLFRPDAPQPATTDDTLERAAAAIAKAADADYWTDEIAEWEAREQWERDAHPDEYPTSAYEDREAFRSQARAALAVAEEVVDREVRRCEHDPGCIVAHSVNCREKNGVDREHVDDYLAARGDAATPTEVEWGVRLPTGRIRKMPDEVAARRESASLNAVYARETHVVQRTVSAWREAS